MSSFDKEDNKLWVDDIQQCKPFTNIAACKNSRPVSTYRRMEQVEITPELLQKVKKMIGKRGQIFSFQSEKYLCYDPSSDRPTIYKHRIFEEEFEAVKLEFKIAEE